MTMSVQPQRVRLYDIDVAYIEQGRGEPVIFVHGSLGDYRSWGAQLAPFSEQHRVVSYSRRYHWPNARPSDDVTYGVAQHVADLGALFEARGLAPAHVIGSSYGALTALSFAVERPDLVRSLVLGEPPLLPWLARRSDGSALVEAFISNAFRPAGQALLRGETEAGVRLFLDGVFGAGSFDRLPPSARDAMLDNAPAMRAETTTPPERYFPDLPAEAVRRLRTPTLLVQGEMSPSMFGLVTDELARALPAAERATIPASTHGMHAQNPAAYNAVVLAFLTKH